MSSKQQFEIVHGFPAGPNMDVHTEQAWTLWQSAWSAAVASRPDIDDLSLENSLVRARNERLEEESKTMLSSLQMFLALDKSFTRGSLGTVMACTGPMAEAVYAARVAVAKATGGQP